MKKFIILFIIAGLFSTSCKDSDSKDGGNASEEGKKYKVEEAIIEYQMDMMGMVAKATLYFKDYGQTQCVEAEMEMMGMKSVTRSLEKEGYSYTLNMEQKSGSKVKIDKKAEDFDPNDMDFENLSKEMIDKFKIVEKGSEEVSGKDCKVYSMTIEGQEAKFWVWKNIPIKYEMSQSNMTMVMKAVKVDENPKFPDGIFDIPEGFTIEEAPAAEMPAGQ